MHPVVLYVFVTGVGNRGAVNTAYNMLKIFHFKAAACFD
jgi:hypothetical protein